MARRIESLHRGHQQGFIRRLIDPAGLGLRLKPFVFLDYLNGQVPEGAGFGFHPHSGIATLTYQLNADASYEDTAGQKGLVEATGLEWMRAGGGTWHQGFIHPHSAHTEGFQLWVALPAALETGPAEGIYLPPSAVPQVGPVRVLLGSFGEGRNPIPTPSPMTYLDVVLAPRETFTYPPADDETVAFAFVYQGAITANGAGVAEGELAVFEPSTEPLTLRAQEPSRILFGSAAPHPYALHLGPHSVHTSTDALAFGAKHIAEVQRELSRAGRLSR